MALPPLSRRAARQRAVAQFGPTAKTSIDLAAPTPAARERMLRELERPTLHASRRDRYQQVLALFRCAILAAGPDGSQVLLGHGHTWEEALADAANHPARHPDAAAHYPNSRSA